jgi:phosphodiesterase/alkaline phosphatase D-like protein
VEATSRVTALVLGPLLRHVGARDATVWVETSAPCAVEVRAGTSSATDRTFHVAGHHYAIVVVDALDPGSSTPYEVFLDGERAWPADSRRPPSRIRTLDAARPLRLAFGSCREPGARGSHRNIDPDVLIAYAERLMTAADDDWPSALLLVGDQVYADDTSPAMRAAITRHRDPSTPPGYEVANFEEYTWLYREAWTEPSIRWLLSTVPVSMIFDDHDVHDDWNTSHAWRLDVQATTWWEERITGALMSYWIYQHLGNLSPQGLAANATLRAVRAADDGAELLRAFAQHADREVDGAKGTM